MNSIFKIILMINLILFSYELTMCSEDSQCSSDIKESTCEIAVGETSGYCKCIEGYEVTMALKCQKTVNYGDNCDDYDICGTNQKCDETTNKCVCNDGLTFKDNECKEENTEQNTNTDIDENTNTNTDENTNTNTDENTNTNTNENNNDDGDDFDEDEDSSSSKSNFIKFTILTFACLLL